MKNKKIISLIAAVAMIFSMFSAFTVNAEGEKGIDLSGSLSKDGTKVTIVAKAVGTAAALNSFGVKLNVPEGVTSTDAISATSQSGVKLTTGLKDGIYTVSFADDAGVEFKDNVLTTIVFTLGSPLSQDYTATLQNLSTVEDANGFVLVPNTMTATSVKVDKYVDPNAPADKADRPAKDETPEPPEVTPVQPEGKGIELTGSANDSNTEITVIAKAVGTAAALNSFGVKLNVPDGVTSADAISATSQSGVKLTTGLKDGVYTVSFADDAGVTFTDNVLATIKFTLSSPLTSAYVATLQNLSTVEDASGFVLVPNTMTASSAVIKPSEKAPKGSALLSKFLPAGADDVAADAAQTKTVYMTVDVKDKTGNPIEYGNAGFVAEYGGKILSKKEFTNLIGGYVENTDWKSVIDTMKILIYHADGTAATVGVTLNTVEDEKQLVKSPGDLPVGGSSKPTPTPKAGAPTLKASADSTSIAVNSLTKITAIVTEAADAQVNPTEVEFSITSGGDYLEFVAGDGPQTVALNNDGKASVKVNATNKTGKAVVTVKAAYTNKDGVEDYVTTTVNITVRAEQAGDTTSSDKKNTGGGSIAGPADAVGSLGGNLLGLFSDINDAEWAKDAIIALSLKGVVSGYEDNSFRPNNNVTRAEYCQILIGAIDKTSESADSYFADVPSDAWYYHAVSVANAYGIVSGYGNGNFGPYDLITRQDMALMTYKAAAVMNKNVAATRNMSFADANEISDYAADAVMALANAGIINGVSDTEFAPKANATRAQAARILYDTFVKVN